MNFHHLKLEYMKAAELCVLGHFKFAKNPLKWVVSHSKKYKSLHLDSGLALACVYKRQEKHGYALKMLNYLIESYEADSKILGMLHLDLALAKYHVGDFSGAEKSASMASDFDTADLSPKQLWYLLMLEGRYYSLRGDYQEAIRYQETAWPICEEIQSKYQMMQVVSNIGHNLFDLGDDDEGDKFVKEGLKIACRIGAQDWAARNYLVLMQLAFRKGDILEAKEYGKRCFMLAYRNGYRGVVEEASQSTGDYYRAIGDTEVADVFYQKAVSVGTESPAQVLEKVNRIYDTAYSERRLDVKFNSSGDKWVLDGSSDSMPSTGQAGKVIKYRYIIGSVKSKSKRSQRIEGEGESPSYQQ